MKNTKISRRSFLLGLAACSAVRTPAAASLLRLLPPPRIPLLPRLPVR